MNNFFIVGAQRCSTTWLYHMLNAHPTIQMNTTIRPEPKYFLKDDCILDQHSYFQSVFNQPLPNDNKVYGEKSTSYIESVAAAQKIKALFPDAKIVILVRDPIKRAISNYYFSLNNGVETRSCLDAVLGKGDRPVLKQVFSTDPFDYLGRGRYEKYIEDYFAVFGHDQVGIFVQENITNDISSLNEVFDFLAVDPTLFKSDIHIQHNSSQKENDTAALEHELYQTLSGYYDSTYDYLKNYVNIDCWKR
ncbi:sulfotransferase [Vibrio fluvialis]|uniref:sulfotransferase family protein n=1 Tax=Vibrio fluvialis TaxID=676 RepID=UPI00192C8EAB|nr:sulfotransferase [Vibrio fluvialis]MBL4280041.1 sulfotransferase [Vibrio fluvialis]